MRVNFVILFLFVSIAAKAQGQFYYIDKAGVYSLDKIETYFTSIDLKSDKFLFISNNTEPIVCRSNIKTCIDRIGDIKPQTPSINYELDTLVDLLDNYLSVNPRVDWHFFIDYNIMTKNHFEIKFIQRLILVTGNKSNSEGVISNVYVHVDESSLSESQIVELRNKNFIYGNSFKILLY